MDEQATVEDIDILTEEAFEDSAFDRLQLRKRMWNDLVEGRAELLCRTCPYGKVLIICQKGMPLGISWSLWGRILQGFVTRKNPVRICWFASEVLRILPDAPHVKPEHVNGGYTFPCELHAVVIYRKEEATRVLIHELLHATCTDNPRAPVEKKETATETYAELFLIAYASKGSQKLARKLWALQAKWIAEQNYNLRHYYDVTDMSKYAARYTIGREEELRSLGIELPPPQSKARNLSSRFTSRELDKYLL